MAAAVEEPPVPAAAAVAPSAAACSAPSAAAPSDAAVCGEALRITRDALEWEHRVLAAAPPAAGELGDPLLAGQAERYAAICSAAATLYAVRHVAAQHRASAGGAASPDVGDAASGAGDAAAAELLGRCDEALPAALLHAAPAALRARALANWAVSAAGESPEEPCHAALHAVLLLNEAAGALVASAPLHGWHGAAPTHLGLLTRHCIAADALLAAAATARAAAALAAPTNAGVALTHDGVAATDAAMLAEWPHAAWVCGLLGPLLARASGPGAHSGNGRPWRGVLPLRAPSDAPVCHARAVSGVWLQGPAPVQLRAYYMSAYAAALVCPRIARAECGPVWGPALPAAPVAALVEWPRRLWEAEQCAPLHVVCERLHKENWAIPREVWDPLDDLPQLGPGAAAEECPDALRAPQLQSEWAAKASDLLRDLREDAEDAGRRRPPPPGSEVTVTHDCGGRWRAAREVLTVVLAVVTELLGAAANALHARVDRFGYSDANVLPLLLLASDAHTLLCDNFDSGVTALLAGGRLPPPEGGAPARLNLEALEAVAGIELGGHYPGNAGRLLPRMAIIVGVAVDKARADIEKVCLRAARTYCQRVLGRAEQARAKAAGKRGKPQQQAGAEDDSDSEEWTDPQSKEADTLVRRTLHPVLCVCARIAPQVRRSVAPFATGRVVAALATAVASHLLPPAVREEPGLFGVLPSAGTAAPPALPRPEVQRASITAAGQEPRLLVRQLWEDLGFVAQYLRAASQLGAAERAALLRLPEWHAAARLEHALATAASAPPPAAGGAAPAPATSGSAPAGGGAPSGQP